MSTPLFLHIGIPYAAADLIVVLLAAHSPLSAEQTRLYYLHINHLE